MHEIRLISRKTPGQDSEFSIAKCAHADKKCCNRVQDDNGVSAGQWNAVLLFMVSLWYQHSRGG